MPHSITNLVPAALATLLAACSGIGSISIPEPPAPSGPTGPTGAGDVCEGVTCSGAGSCVDSAGTASCICDNGYHADGLSCVLDDCDPTSHASLACDQGDVYHYDSCGGREEMAESCAGIVCVVDTCVDPCASVTCSGHGTCGVNGVNPLCTCDTNYVVIGGTECIPDPCIGVDCTEDGTCVLDGVNAACDCNQNYAPQGLTCVYTPCFGVTCSGLGTCMDDDGVYCDCDEPLINGPGYTCIDDPCPAVDCSGQGTCYASQGEPACWCDDGFVADGLACVCDPRPYAATGCVGDEVFWFDSCGGQGALRETCGVGECLVDHCDTPWFSLGASDFGPAAVVMRRASASGGGVSNSAGSSDGASIALEADGTPVIAWTEYSLPYPQIHVARWNGTDWQGYGPSHSPAGVSNASGYGAYSADLCLDDTDKPIVVWRDSSDNQGEIFVRRWTGTDWVEMGTGSASGGGISNTPTKTSWGPAIDCADGLPFVAWAESETGDSDIYVRHFDGATWNEVGTGSASGDGIPPETGYALSPDIAVGLDGDPIVVWRQDGATSHTYVRRFDSDGPGWEEMGTGSSSGTGISGSASAPYPRVVVDGSGAAIVAFPGNPGVVRFNGSEWETLGTPPYVGNSPPGLAFDESGDLLLAATNGRDIIVQRFDGPSWVEHAPGSGSTTGVSNVFPYHDTASSPALAARGTHAAVAWSWYPNGGSSEIYLKVFVGGAWTELGTPTAVGGGVSNTPDGHSTDPAIVLAEDGTATIAWLEMTGQGYRRLYARQRIAGQWEPLGPIGPSGVGIAGSAMEYLYRPRLILDADGAPLVTWAGSTNAVYDIYVKRWNGTAWEELGGSGSGGGVSNSAAYSADPVLALDPTGRPVVAWSENVGGNPRIYVRVFDGAVWQELGTNGASGTGASGVIRQAFWPSLVFDGDGQAVLAWWDFPDTTPRGDIYARRLVGNDWVEIGTGSASGGGISNDAGYSSGPALAIDSNGAPVLAWVSNDFGTHILVRRFNGTSWEEMGSGSATGGGISNHAQSTLGSGDYYGPAIVSGEAPAVVWNFNDGIFHEIYLRQWTGAAWAEVGLSASGGGISNSLGTSFQPAIARNSDALCVAWSERAARANEIVVRCVEQ